MILFPTHPTPTDATLSPDGLHRYTLRRTWAPGPALLFLGLNPSTADAEADDPTVRRLKGFAEREGYGTLAIANLLPIGRPFRQPCGNSPPEERLGLPADSYLTLAVIDAHAILCGWGACAKQAAARIDAVFSLLEASGRPLYRLGLNADGTPTHPLDQRADAPFVRYSRAVAMGRQG